MNITKTNIDKLNAKLNVHVEKTDYDPKVEASLNDYKRKVQLKGFRPGKVPMGIIRKMVGTQVLVEEVNKLVYESIAKYLNEQEIHILGEPMINEKEQPKIDWEKQAEFTFVFDLGLAPEIDLNLSSKDKIVFYKITVDDKMIDEYVAELTQRFGSYKTLDTISGDEMIRCNMAQLDESGKIKEGGISKENTPMILSVVKDEEIKKKFIGAKLQDKLQIDVRKAFDRDVEIASLLGISKEKAASLTHTVFELTIIEILKYEKAEMNKELFDKVFGADASIASEEEFRKRLAEDLAKSLEADSDYRFTIDAKEHIIEKANIKLPVDFLKRWMLFSNKEFTQEQLDDEFPKFEDEFKWQLIRNDIIKKNNISVSEQEIKDYAKAFAAYQFRQYGINNFAEEHLEKYASSMLKNDEERRRLYERKIDEKVMHFIKSTVTLQEKEIDRDKFKTLFEKKNKK